jgi:hypothetical protein
MYSVERVNKLCMFGLISVGRVSTISNFIVQREHRLVENRLFVDSLLQTNQQGNPQVKPSTLLLSKRLFSPQSTTPIITTNI